MKSDIRNVAIIGLGAVGTAYAKYIVQNAPEINLFGVVRDLDHFWGKPILLNDAPLQINYRTIDTLRSIPLDLILLCVKSYQMEEAVRSIADIVGEDTILMTMTGGLESEECLAAAFGEERVVRSTFMGAAIARNDRYVTLSRMGTLYYGTERKEAARAVGHFLGRCRIPHKPVDAITHYLWAQLLMDVSVNQLSAVYQLTYGKLRKSTQAMEIMGTVQAETTAVAASYGVKLSKTDIQHCERLLKEFPADGCSTMLQDYWMNRRLETDIFGEYICRLAAKKNIAVPANTWLCEELRSLIRCRSETPFKDTIVCGLSIRKNIQITPEKIANQLRTDIIMAKLAPNEKIAENDLAKRFDVSRNSVRTALQMLTNEGFLRMLPNGRRETVEFGEKQVEDLFDTRWLLENRAVELLLTGEQSVYPLLARSLSEIEQKYRSHSDNSEWSDLDIGFHRSLILSTQNISLLNAWKSGMQQLYALLYLNSITQNTSHFGTEFFGKHRYLYEMILSGDRTVFSELKRHIAEEKVSAVAIVKSFKR